MDCLLTRTSYESSGIYSILKRVDTLNPIAVTLEHAYPAGTGPITYIAKLPPGEYVCQRGLHLLKGMSVPFETFEIMDVPGHSDILFHVGNTNDDSEGCVLLGSSRSHNMIVESRITFNAFMQLQAGLDVFNLVVQ